MAKRGMMILYNKPQKVKKKYARIFGGLAKAQGFGI